MFTQCTFHMVTTLFDHLLNSTQRQHAILTKLLYRSHQKEVYGCSNQGWKKNVFFKHHAISLISELHSNNLLYLLWHSKVREKKCSPFLFSQSIVGQFTPSKVVRLAKHAHSKHRKATPTQPMQFHNQVYVHALVVQHLLNIFFQHMVWYSLTSETAWMKRRQKAEEDNQ